MSTIPSTGYFSFSNIRSVFASSATGAIYLSHFYANATQGYTTGVSGIPNIGTKISFSNFQGKAKASTTTSASASSGVSGSTILNSTHYTAINTLFPSSTLSILYRGSRDGYTKAAFLTKCSGIAPIWVVYKVASSNAIPTAYSTVAFTNSGGYKAATGNWLNKLDDGKGGISTKKYTASNNYDTNAILDSNPWGFGGGWDLAVADNYTTSGTGGWNYTYTYIVPAADLSPYTVGSFYSSGVPNGLMTLTDMEVYKVTDTGAGTWTIVPKVNSSLSSGGVPNGQTTLLTFTLNTTMTVTTVTLSGFPNRGMGVTSAGANIFMFDSTDTYIGGAWNTFSSYITANWGTVLNKAVYGPGSGNGPNTPVSNVKYIRFQFLNGSTGNYFGSMIEVPNPLVAGDIASFLITIT